MSAANLTMIASLHTKALDQRTDPCAPAPGRRATDGYGAVVQRQRMMARAVEAEIVPRLVLRRRGLAGSRSAAAGYAPGAADVAEFARLTVARDPQGPRAFIAALRAQGASLETLYLDLITPAARRLGQQWEDDDLDFMQVTEGLGRMQHALFELSPDFVDEIAFNGHGRRALLLPAPGEQHTLGLSMVGEFFRRAGWDVWTDPATDPAELLALVRAESFTVIGFSALCDDSLDALSGLIRQVRRASRNRGIGVMVGGPVFAACPEMAAQVGADATAADGRLAVMQAQSMLTMLPGRD